MKMIINSQKTKLYIDTKEIIATKVDKIETYYLIKIYLKSGKEIELKCDEVEIDDILNRLKN